MTWKSDLIMKESEVIGFSFCPLDQNQLHLCLDIHLTFLMSYRIPSLLFPILIRSLVDRAWDNPKQMSSGSSVTGYVMSRTVSR